MATRNAIAISYKFITIERKGSNNISPKT